MKQINVTQSSMPPKEEYFNEISSVWDNKWLTNFGPKHKCFEEKLNNYLTVKHILSFTNGHLALETAIAALELTGEVITTPFTFISTTQAIVRNGLTPVFCDIDPENYTIDANKIEALITDKTSAIVAVHVYGSICDVDKIEEIAKKHNLKVIYDAAHAFGVRAYGRGIGEYGDASMFSFHATKAFNTIEGGCVTFSTENLKDKMKSYQNFGIDGEDCIYTGLNAKMTEFQAAMGICNLRHIDEYTLKRKKIVDRYTERLGNVEGIKIWKEQRGVIHNYSYFPVVFNKDVFGKSRDDVLSVLKENEIYARKYFYPLTSEFSCYKNQFVIQSTPIAKKISEQVLTLPLYADLEIDDVDRICDIVLR